MWGKFVAFEHRINEMMTTTIDGRQRHVMCGKLGRKLDRDVNKVRGNNELEFFWRKEFGSHHISIAPDIPTS